MLGQTGQAAQNTGQFPGPCLHAVPGSKDVCAHSLGEGFLFLTALWGLPLVCKTNKGAQLPGVRPQGWGAQYVTPTAHSPVRISACIISLLFGVPFQGYKSQCDCSLSFLPDSHLDLSYSLGCTGVCHSPVSFQ